MVLVRPVSIEDLDEILRLAEQAGVGLTTLPKDRELLRRRILKSQRSIENIPDRPGGESYLFVMVDVDSGRVIGASGIVSKVGGFEPFYAYRLETRQLSYPALKLRKQIQILHLVREHDGPAEVGSLFLSPDYRKKDNGRFLQLVRFLFLAEHADAFEPVVVSELRGVIDEHGRSPFWDAVGKHFFEIDFPVADHLSVVNKKFIADLMPEYPIYVPMLPTEAQQVIGKVHESSKPAMKNLEGEGFRFSGMVDIFDGGACISCQRDSIRTVRESRVVTLAETGVKVEGPMNMICAAGARFRATLGAVEMLAENRVRLAAEVAQLLEIKLGDAVRFARLRPEEALKMETAPTGI
jgi:arginine N-succinyltransferase